MHLEFIRVSVNIVICTLVYLRVALKALREAKTTTLSYKNAEDKCRFNTIVFVLTKVHELLLKNLTVTRR